MYCIHEFPHPETGIPTEAYYNGSVEDMPRNTEQYYSDSYIIQSGMSLKTYGLRVCSPDYRMTNRFVNRYVIHYIISGKGWCNGISIEEGDCIFFTKAQPYNFSADPHNPATYAWITFRGGRSESYLEQLGLTKPMQIFHSDKMKEIYGILYDMMYVDHKNNSEVEDMYLESCFVHLLSIAKPSQANNFTSQSNVSRRVYDTMRYIASNYSNPELKISEIAEAVHTNEKYLSRIFKQETGNSMQQYLNSVRMSAAIQLLSSSNYNINEISEFVGYNNRRNFTDMFKKQFGVPPSKYSVT